jgi:hypothetical protein
MKNVFLALDPLTTETFETRLRMRGYSFCSGMGRLGAVVMPYIVFALDEKSKAAVYLLLSSLMLAGTVTVQCNLDETMHKQLN